MELAEFAKSYSNSALSVLNAAVTLDEGQDGEPLTRMLLLLSDPEGGTWGVEALRELRFALGRKATELGLPPATFTLVAESEEEAREAFVQ